MKGNLELPKCIVNIVIGALAIILALACFLSDTGVFERESAYGGDAYTGIQNAAAITANNVKCVAGIASLGFGSVLLILGFSFASRGVFGLLEAGRGLGKNEGAPSSSKKEGATNSTVSLQSNNLSGDNDAPVSPQPGVAKEAPSPMTPQPPKDCDDASK